MDYGALPPEVNSGLMYTGVGSGSLMAAAAAWQALAAELGVSATSFDAVIDTLATGPWLGPSSVAMASAALPYIAWMTTTAAAAEEHALAAAGTAMAFETARAAVIHPAVIAENRTELATLIATNFLGVNSAAIAANEAEYAGFWATDASTMYGYAGQLAGITGAMIPFLPPVPDANPAGPAADAAAVAQAAGQSAGQAGSQVSGAMGQMASMPSTVGGAASMVGMAPQMASAIPQALQGLASPLSSLQGLASPLSSLGNFSSFLSPLMGMATLANGAGLSGVAGSLNALNATPGLSGGFGGFTPMASMARGATLNGAGPRLSIPASWAESVKTERVTPLITTADEAAPEAAVMGRPMVPASVAGGPSGGTPAVYPPGMRGSLGVPEGQGRPRSLPVTKVAKLIF